MTLWRDSLIFSAVRSGVDGLFEFKNLKPGNYRLKTSIVGYISKDTLLKIERDTHLVIILNIGNHLLSSVYITANRKFIEKKVDRVVYNISGNSLYENKSVTDILKSIPQINITNNAIELKGHGTVAVMIDDHLIYLSNKDLLDYLSVFKNDIANIEIIPNPPSKYEAQGSGLININTKKTKINGVFGYFESSVTKNSYLENDETLNLGYRNKNLSISTSFGDSFGAYQESITNNFISDKQVNWNEIEKNKNSFQNSHFFIVAEWLLSIKTKLYSSYSRATLHNTTVERGKLNYTNDNTLDSIGSTNGKSSGNSRTNLFNVGLKSSFGKKINSVDASVDYVDKTSIQQINTETINYNDDLNTPTNTTYNLYSFGNIPKNVLSSKVDFIFPQLLLTYNLEFGLKYNIYNNNSETDYNKQVNNQTIFNGVTTRDTFHYKEQDIEAYISFDKRIKKWVTKFGLRYEKTITAEMPFSGPVKNDFSNFFPSAFLQYNIGDGTSLDFSFTRRINRPTLFDVNPFRFYTSILSYYEGNPALIPSLQNNLNLNYNLDSKFLFGLFYNIIYSPIVSLPFNTGDQIVTVKENNGKVINYGFNFNANFNFDPLMQSNFDVSINKNTYYSSYSYVTGHKSFPLNVSFSTVNSVKINPTLSADINFSATLPGQYNTSSTKGYSSFDCGLTKSLVENRIILTLAAQDIFHSSSQGSTTKTDSFITSTVNYYDFRQLMISVRYKFGKVLKVARKKNNIQESYRL